MGDLIGWYSIDEKLKTVEHPPVALPEALDIAKKYYANGGKKYDSAEKGMMETFFGFMRNESTFIELSVNGADLVSYKFEMSPPVPKDAPWYKKIFLSGVFDRECDLHSWPEVEAKITEFFTDDAETIRARLTQK